MTKWKFLPLLLVLIFPFLLPAPRTAAADEKWRARYWNNDDLSGDPVLKRDEDAIDHDWGDDSPHNSVNKDDFSARWTRTVYLSGGTYRFSATMDDGMRVWIDDALVIDAWQDSQEHTVAVNLPMTAGEHEIEVQYYEAGGKAVAKFSWAPVSGAPTVPINQWLGRYYSNQNLAGAPTFTRADNAINFDWKLGSPWPSIPNDRFSVRWTGDFEHMPGRYHFTATSDDGVRLWVNNVLLIDEWGDNQSATFEAFTDLPGGVAPVQLDYFENTGAALIRLSAEKTGAAGAPAAPGPVSPVQPALPPPGTAVVAHANWLNVRSTPGVADNVITAVSRGTEMGLIGRNGGWIKVRLPGGSEGWVGSSYLASRTPLFSLPVVQ